MMIRTELQVTRSSVLYLCKPTVLIVKRNVLGLFIQTAVSHTLIIRDSHQSSTQLP